jgi:hypothetical protein
LFVRGGKRLTAYVGGEAPSVGLASGTVDGGDVVSAVDASCDGFGAGVSSELPQLLTRTAPHAAPMIVPSAQTFIAIVPPALGLPRAIRERTPFQDTRRRIGYAFERVSPYRVGLVFS